MKISNIQENLTKTELVQRLQQIMQDAARASQDVQTARGDERSRIAQEEVETSERSEQDQVREEGKGGESDEGARRKKRRRQAQADPAAGPIDHRPPSDEGRIIDIVV